MLVDPVTFRRLVRARDRLAVDDAITVRELARDVALSQSHLIRSFAAVFGETPHRWRTRQRIERAKALLARGAPVTDACLEVGFASVGSFSALFTRWHGAAPSRYRRAVSVPRAIALVPGCLGLLAAIPAWPSHSREARAQ